jgi:hypothetical protein
LRYRLNEAWVAFFCCATPGVIFSLGLPAPWSYPVGAVAVCATIWSVHRAFRICLTVSHTEILVDNYWVSHRFPWSDVSGVGVALKQLGVLPQPAVAFQRRTARPVFAKATPFRESDRSQFVSDVLAFAPADVTALDDVAARSGIGSDNAPSHRLELWAKATGIRRTTLTAVAVSVVAAPLGIGIGVAVIVGARREHAGTGRYALATLFLVAGTIACVVALIGGKHVVRRRRV